jgi:hypothetical protein
VMSGLVDLMKAGKHANKSSIVTSMFMGWARWVGVQNKCSQGFMFVGFLFQSTGGDNFLDQDRLGESEETIFVPNNINAQEGTNITF